MFFGQYAHTLDEKNRLMIPRKMRNELGDKIYILSGYDGCINLYQEESFKKMCEQVSALSFDHKLARDYIRHRLTSASEIEIDKSGRIQIPMNIINKFKFNKDVIVLGVLDHIEIWDKVAYEQYEANVDEQFEAIAEEVNKL